MKESISINDIDSLINRLQEIKSEIINLNQLLFNERYGGIDKIKCKDSDLFDLDEAIEETKYLKNQKIAILTRISKHRSRYNRYLNIVEKRLLNADFSEYYTKERTIEDINNYHAVIESCDLAQNKIKNMKK